MSTSSSETELLMYTKDDSWNASAESIFTQRITKLSKSESLFDVCARFHPSLTFSELELRETRMKNFKEKAKNSDLAQDRTRLPRIIRTRSLLRDELEMLKINMSIQNKIIAFRQSQLLGNFQMEPKKWKKGKRFMKFERKPPSLLQKCAPRPKVKNLISEIEESESAKTDTVIWKFLKRGPSFRRDYINARKIFLEIQTLQLPGLGFFPDSRFQNTQSIRVTCPNCMFYITTLVKKVSSIRTKFLSIVLAVVGLCIVPHVFYAFKDTVHICPLCKIYLGFCPAFNTRPRRRGLKILEFEKQKYHIKGEKILGDPQKMVSASSTSAKNLFVESKLRLSDRVQVNVNNIAAITRQIQRGSKSNENLMVAAKNFALQEAAIENSETNLKKLKLLTSHINSQLDLLQKSSTNMELVLEQVRSMQR